MQNASSGAAVRAQEIVLLIRNVASLSMHYLNLKARYSQTETGRQTGRQAGSAHVPCFSFINLAENPFIKLSAAIIYAPPSTAATRPLPSPPSLSFFRCGSCAGATKIIANYRREKAAKCVAGNASQFSLWVSLTPLYLSSPPPSLFLSPFLWQNNNNQLKVKCATKSN